MDPQLPSRSDTPFLYMTGHTYGPHNKLAEDTPQLVANFHDLLKGAFSVPVNIQIVVFIDFNTKLGKPSSSGIDFGFNNFMVNYKMGTCK